MSGGILPWTFTNVDLDDVVMNAARAHRSDYPETRDKSLEEFINAICNEESIQPYLDKDFLMRFLRCGKFKIVNAVRRLKRYYRIKRDHPEIFRDFLPSCTLKAQALHHLSALPYRAPDHSMILIIRVGKWDPNTVSFEEIVRLDRLAQEFLLINPVTQLCGFSLLLDFTGFSMLHMFTPSRMNTLIDLYHSSNALRSVNVHVINAPVLANHLFDLVQRLVLSDQSKNRLFFHAPGDWDSLHSKIPSEILPEEFGGHLRSSEIIPLYDLLNDHEEYFLQQIQNCKG